MNTNKTFLRAALRTDCDTLSDIAHRSKAHWGYSEKFLKACENELSVAPNDINAVAPHHWVAEWQNHIMGFYALEKTSKTEYELAALFIEPQHIAKGLGRKLLEHAKLTACQYGATVLFIQSDPHAREFYSAIGAAYIGEKESSSIPGRFLPEFSIRL